MTKHPQRWLVPLAAFAAVLPMLIFGASCGHDFDFHLLNWLEAQTQLAHGGWPRWAYTPAFNAGEPRFLFYPPLSWLLGAALTAVLPFQLVPAAFTFLLLTLSGFSMYRLVVRHAPGLAATLVATLYLLNPYMLFTAYERTAYGELLAAAVMPLLFAAMLEEKPQGVRVAVPVALLWLTNAPAAVMGSYALAVLALSRLAMEKRTRRGVAGAAAGGMALGLALAAFYIVPAAYERRFVQISMAVIPGMTPGDNFLFHHTSDAAHDAVLHTASLIACGLLALFLLALAAAWKRAERRILQPVAALGLLIAVMLTPLSLPLWMHLPELAFLQFPWRLLAVLTPACGVILALALGRWRMRWPIGAAVLAVAAGVLITPSWRSFQQGCEVQDAPLGRAAVFHSNSGTEPTDEYTPTDADGDALKPGDPAYWLVPRAQDPAQAQAPAGMAAAALPHTVTVTSAVPVYLVLNRRQYPAWQIRVNGRVVLPHEPVREDGLITLDLPAGTDVVELTLRRTADVWAGLMISAVALLLLIMLWRRRSVTLG